MSFTVGLSWPHKIYKSAPPCTWAIDREAPERCYDWIITERKSEQSLGYESCCHFNSCFVAAMQQSQKCESTETGCFPFQPACSNEVKELWGELDLKLSWNKICLTEKNSVKDWFSLLNLFVKQQLGTKVPVQCYTLFTTLTLKQ